MSSSDLGIENNDAEIKEEENDAENKALFDSMKDILNGKISAVKISKRLKNHPVCLSNEGDLSIEMEKVLNQMPNAPVSYTHLAVYKRQVFKISITLSSNFSISLSILSPLNPRCPPAFGPSMIIPSAILL